MNLDKLRAGDICITRNGIVMIAIPNLSGFIAPSGYEIFYNYTYDLKSKYFGEGYDIIKVYRPHHAAQLGFMPSTYTTGDLIYDEGDTNNETTHSW